MSRTLLVVGHGMVGHRLVEEMRARDRDDRWHLVAVTDEPRPAYNRVLLSSYLKDDDPGVLDLVRPEMRADPLVELRCDTSVTQLDTRMRIAHCADGTSIDFDAVVLATGSRPFVPRIPGHALPGCFVYRTLDDLHAIRAVAVPGGVGVVVGGGLLGLEAADALRHLGLRPHVIETAPHPLPRQVDQAGGALLAELLEAIGVRVHCGVAVRSAHAGEGGRVCAVTLTDDQRIETGIVIFAAGVRPRDELAGDAGLGLAGHGGILVDERCRTGVAGVWAIGECAAVDGRTYGLIAPGYRMAESVARQLTGTEPPPMSEVDTSTRLKVLGIDVASFGATHATADTVEYAHSGARTYAKLVLGTDGRTLHGGVLVGEVGSYPTLSTLVGRELPTAPDPLMSVSA